MNQLHSAIALENKSNIRVSVLICTRNRAESLRSVLVRWSTIKADIPWEILIIDNDSNDHTKDVFQDCKNNFDINIIYIFEKKTGLSNARNCGINNAKGDIIFFTDDDCYPENNIIQKLFEAIQLDKLDYVGGMITLHDKRDAPITIKTDKEKSLFKKNTYIPPGMIHGACIVFRKHVFDSLGLFNENLGAGTFLGSGEDSEFICRASMAGLAGGYNPCFSVSHNHGRREKKQVDNLLKYYERGRGAIYAYMMIYHSKVMIKHINKIFNDKNTIQILKKLYWMSRERFPMRVWNISLGFVLYWVWVLNRQK